MPVEIERKWLLRELPKHHSWFHSPKLTQVYLPSGLRIRLTSPPDGSHFYEATLKGEGDLERKEQECRLEEWLARNLLQSNIDVPRITKYRIQTSNGFDIERPVIDYYVGNLNRLILAEAEFDSSEDPAEYELPKFIQKVVVREVTYDPRYKNYNLAKTQEIPMEI